jgi:hypothetical protein
MIVDYDGRILSQADPGPGEKIVVGPIDLAALRAERERRRGHHMLAHLRMEAYRAYEHSVYLGGLTEEGGRPPTLEGNERAIAAGRRRVMERLKTIHSSDTPRRLHPSSSPREQS